MNDSPTAIQTPEEPQDRATPVMAQFLELKAGHPGSLLFYRMGDFYELFFEDAEIAARDLGITLTKRGKHLGQDIPMCGVPVHSADGYLQRLIRIGHKVAVCEQMEDPAEARKRGSKAVVKRDVVRLVTPGTLTEDNLLDSRSHNYLAAVCRHRGTGDWAISWADISSGELAVMTSGIDRVIADLVRLNPSEIVVPESFLGDPELSNLLDRVAIPISPLPQARFDFEAAERRLLDFFNVSALDAFGSFARHETGALGGLLEYIIVTQAGRIPYLRNPRQEQTASVLLMDPATRTNLELTRTLSGERQGSLLAVMDMAITAAGSRCLASRLATPLLDPVAITCRLDAVSFFAEMPELREDIRRQLSQFPDLERGLGRLAVGRGGPRDLACVRSALTGALALASELSGVTGISGLPEPLETLREQLTASDIPLVHELTLALADDLPLLARDGGFIRSGYSGELDENRALRDETKQVIASLQTRYCDVTGIKALKVRHNNVLGYFIEIPASSAGVMQSADQAASFIHRQTVANAMRYVTTELVNLDHRIAAAADRAVALEQEIFAKLTGLVIAQRDLLSAVAAAAAELDAAAALAELAEQRKYVRPKIDASISFVVKGGRHPVVEAMMAHKASGSFVANDCDLSGNGKRLWLLTGPNMAGKSTYLRQNALIVIMAQMGSFVPAEEAHIGVVDRLFSRVGAADDLARGRSTFMVEMVETAAILNQSTERSFVILDEIGRGTATYDGLSIAWATLEHLHGANKCRALFATHYHELTSLAAKLSHLANATVKVREWEDQIIFLHEVVPGVADRSYGIHVARLAGLPKAVIDRAQKVLDKLEQGDAKKGMGFLEDLPLFAAAPPISLPKESVIEKKLAALTPDELSPREAHALLYELKALLATRT